jgi:hypothetical protein
VTTSSYVNSVFAFTTVFSRGGATKSATSTMRAHEPSPASTHREAPSIARRERILTNTLDTARAPTSLKRVWVPSPSLPTSPIDVITR